LKTQNESYGFFLKHLKNKVKDLNMMPKEKKSLTDPQKNVENLRCKLTKYQNDGTEPPASLLVELKMAELLVKLESINTIRVSIKDTMHINVNV
jgi:hypothetical protein